MKRVTVLIGIAVFFFAGPMLLAAEPELESPKTSEATTEQLDSHMQKMQEQMKRIHATNDPTERKQMMHEHMQDMHAGVAMMSDMGDEEKHVMMNMGDEEKHVMMNMGDMQMQEGDSHSHKVGMSCQGMTAMDGRFHDMQQQMHMMQKMMEQMMEHQSVQEVSSK